MSIKVLLSAASKKKKLACEEALSCWLIQYLHQGTHSNNHLLCAPRNPGGKYFDCTTYGSRVIGQNVKWPVIAPPRGRLEKSGAEFGLAKTENPIYLIKTYTKFLIL